MFQCFYEWRMHCLLGIPVSCKKRAAREHRWSASFAAVPITDQSLLAVVFSTLISHWPNSLFSLALAKWNLINLMQVEWKAIWGQSGPQAEPQEHYRQNAISLLHSLQVLPIIYVSVCMFRLVFIYTVFTRFNYKFIVLGKTMLLLNIVIKYCGLHCWNFSLSAICSVCGTSGNKQTDSFDSFNCTYISRSTSYNVTSNKH